MSLERSTSMRRRNTKVYISGALLLSIFFNVVLVTLLFTQEPVYIETIIREEVIVEVKEELPPLTEEQLINSYILDISSIYNVDPYLIDSIIYHESRHIPTAKNGNCLGLMQVCTTWHMDRAEKLGVKDFYDPYGSILLGVDYISELLDSTDGDVTLTLMLYNMNHKQAYSMHAKGEVSWYASSVLKRVEDLKQGVK
jgi:hypothetical protein